MGSGQVIDSDAAKGGASGVSDWLLGAVTTPLPSSRLAGLAQTERLSVLLEQLMAAAGAGSGAVLIDDAGGQLTIQASHGLPDHVRSRLPSSLDDVAFGLTVRAAAIEASPGLPQAHASALDADTLRMALWLPLESLHQVQGGVYLGFAEFRTLEPSFIQRLGLIVDHLALVAEVGRVTRESADRLTEVERVSAELDEIDRMKGEFLSMISHELRTPLTAIIGYTDLLLRQIHGPLNERQNRHQEAVKKAAHRLLALINDLLDVNRLESGQIVLHVESISLLDAVRRAASQIEHAAELRSVGLRLDMPANHITVMADHERLHQILVNLLDNAIKFTPTGGAVTVRVDQHQDSATVAVIDTGVGVPPEQLDLIWDRFHQADSSTRRHFGGTGLGLAIVRHLVEGHRGSVSVVSEGAGKGSTFAFTLPLAESARRVGIVPEPEIPAPLPSGRGVTRRCTVLIVDDEPDNREVIRSIVQDVLGHIALTAADGQEALSQCRPGLDLILLDLRMPGLSGFEVARQLKADETTASIPILAITAFNEDEELDEARAAGCLGCITKPFTNETLAAAVSSVLAASGAGVGR